jgi:hypothetical protein
MKLTFIGKTGCPCPIKCKFPWQMGNHCPMQGHAFTTNIAPAVSGYNGFKGWMMKMKRPGKCQISKELWMLLLRHKVQRNSN